LHGAISVSLAKSIDSKKLKEGDEIPTKTLGTLRTSDGVTIPNGSMVVGHVTQATARSKGDLTASLGIAFDKILVAGGKDIPIKGTLQAVGPNPSESSGQRFHRGRRHWPWPARAAGQWQDAGSTLNRRGWNQEPATRQLRADIDGQGSEAGFRVADGD
jgi:hypothetical protein